MLCEENLKNIFCSYNCHSRFVSCSMPIVCYLFSQFSEKTSNSYLEKLFSSKSRQLYQQNTSVVFNWVQFYWVWVKAGFHLAKVQQACPRFSWVSWPTKLSSLVSWCADFMEFDQFRSWINGILAFLKKSRRIWTSVLGVVGSSRQQFQAQNSPVLLALACPFWLGQLSNLQGKPRPSNRAS